MSLVVRVAVVSVCLVLVACGSVPIQSGRDQVKSEVVSRQPAVTGAAEPGQGALDDALRTLLAEPLTPEAAVAIAWANSPHIKTVLADLDMAAADAFDSRQVRTPSLSWKAVEGGERALGLGVALGDLIRLPARKRAGQTHWRAAIARTADALLAEAAVVREGYYRYQAAMQIADMREAVAEAAEVSAELARRFYAAGNIHALQLAREEAAAGQARAAFVTARVERLEARMALAERLGLVGRTNRWRLPERLSLPPEAAFDADQLLERAQQERLDLRAAQLDAEAVGVSARSARRLAALDEVGISLERERDGAERTNSAEIEVGLPLFGQSRGSVARAKAQQDRAAHEVERIALEIERAVRTGVAKLDGLREIVDLYRETLVPQREAIVARQQERYNFMLIGVFELLEAKQQEYDTYQAYLEAIRDYWLAHSELTRVVGGPLSSADAALSPAPGIEDLLHDPDAGGHQHHHGDMP